MLSAFCITLCHRLQSICFYLVTHVLYSVLPSTICFDGGTSDAFPVSSGVKQGCVLAPTLFGIFFSMLLHYAFADCEEGIYIRSRTDGKLLNIAQLHTKTKVHELLIRELLFGDDAALTSHSQEGLQRLVDKLSHTCKEFELTISLKKTNMMAQDAESPPVITIENTQLEVVNSFTYLGSTVSDMLNLDTEISSRITKAAGVMAKLDKRVWNNSLLSERTKALVYQACVLHPVVWKGVLDSLRQAGKVPQLVPPPLPPTPLQNQVARQSP